MTMVYVMLLPPATGLGDPDLVTLRSAAGLTVPFAVAELFAGLGSLPATVAVLLIGPTASAVGWT
jgi:hypothetical protein